MQKERIVVSNGNVPIVHNVSLLSEEEPYYVLYMLVSMNPPHSEKNKTGFLTVFSDDAPGLLM